LTVLQLACIFYAFYLKKNTVNYIKNIVQICILKSASCQGYDSPFSLRIFIMAEFRRLSGFIIQITNQGCQNLKKILKKFFIFLETPKTTTLW